MESDLADVEKDIYLEVLSKHTIYKEYLYSLSDSVSENVEGNNKFSLVKITNFIKRLTIDSKRGKRSCILPILISIDSHKTYLYDRIKEKFQNYELFYIPICPLGVRIFYHVYNCLFEELGTAIFEQVDLTPYEVINNDVIKALFEYQQESNRRHLLERWFYEEELNEQEKKELGLSTKISDDQNSLAIIKLICTSFENIVLFFFDDVELIYQKYGEEQGDKCGEKAEIEFLDALNTFFGEVKNAIIIIPCFKESWKILLKYSNNYFRNVLESSKIEFFDLEGLKRKIIKVMDFYWLENKIRPPENPFFPLNADLVENIFEQSQGSIKKFFNLYMGKIEEILSENISEDLD